MIELIEVEGIYGKEYINPAMIVKINKSEACEMGKACWNVWLSTRMNPMKVGASAAHKVLVAIERHGAIIRE